MPVAPARPVQADDAKAAPARWAAIDFGTSNSAVALPDGKDGSGGEGSAVRLVELEPGFFTMPTAVFFRADTPPEQRQANCHYGRAAVAAYVEGADGRLMLDLSDRWPLAEFAYAVMDFSPMGDSIDVVPRATEKTVTSGTPPKLHYHRSGYLSFNATGRLGRHGFDCADCRAPRSRADLPVDGGGTITLGRDQVAAI